MLKAGAKVGAAVHSPGEAKAAGAVTINYGAFINAVITFLIVAFCVFLLVRAVAQLHKAPAAPRRTRKTVRTASAASRWMRRGARSARRNSRRRHRRGKHGIEQVNDERAGAEYSAGPLPFCCSCAYAFDPISASPA